MAQQHRRRVQRWSKKEALAMPYGMALATRRAAFRGRLDVDPIADDRADVRRIRQGDAVDAFNVVNPLIAFANISLANDDGDTYSVTRQSTAIGVTVIVGVVVGKLVPRRGAGTTRGHQSEGPGAVLVEPVRSLV
ncbi:MAG: hypothetical protein IPM54_41000 [Polyangiaceae bacterium]|nr:hypothetical protein [Polyangiaceae bacterium]